MFLLLSNPRFRRFWCGLLFNDAALAIEPLALGWLVLDMTNSPLWVGISAGVAGVGMTVFSPVAGVLADRYNRKYLLILSLAIQSLAALALGILLISDSLQLHHALVFAFVSGLTGSLKFSCKMALTLDLAGRHNLLKAVAANFFSMTIMGVVAPLAGGLILAELGMGPAFFLVGILLLVSLLVVSLLKGIESPEYRATSHVDDLLEGVKYVFRSPPVRLLILAVMVSETFGWAVESMLPVIARDELGLGPRGFSYLMSAGALGAAVTTVTISLVPNIENKGRLILLGMIGFGLGLIVFAFSKLFVLSLLCLALTFGCGVAYESGLSTLIQEVVPDRMRGRVLSFQTFSWGFSGMAGFHAGPIAAVLGAPIAVA
ncbi:MAG TPA: MFS transporter, partial [Dehalococcoidia bacterium]|nr:MFS transporter [Dehalococcoidia bacterium]